MPDLPLPQLRVVPFQLSSPSLGDDIVQRVPEALEGGDELLVRPPPLEGLLVLLGGGLLDLGEEGRVLDQPPVALGLDEGVGDDVVGPVELAREQGVGEAGLGFLAGREALLGGWGGGCLAGKGRVSWDRKRRGLGEEGDTIVRAQYLSLRAPQSVKRLGDFHNSRSS